MTEYFSDVSFYNCAISKLFTDDTGGLRSFGEQNDTGSLLIQSMHVVHFAIVFRLEQFANTDVFSVFLSGDVRVMQVEVDPLNLGPQEVEHLELHAPRDQIVLLEVPDERALVPRQAAARSIDHRHQQVPPFLRQVLGPGGRPDGLRPQVRALLVRGVRRGLPRNRQNVLALAHSHQVLVVK